MLKTRRLTAEHPEYPKSLLALERLPEPLWVRGSLPRTPLVAVVGTRRADEHAIAFTEDLAAELSRQGVGVISGGADGIDAAAHRGAMRFGKTWVVHGTSFEKLFPVHHVPLFQEVLEKGGGWFTEVEAGVPAQRHTFLLRNRIVAALADVVVVVQAPARSGALSTARAAIDLGKVVMSVPSSPWDVRGIGSAGLLLKAALPCLGADDVFVQLNARSQLSLAVGERRRGGGRPSVPDELRAVYDALGPRLAHVDTLAAAVGKDVREVLTALVRLELLGLARMSGGRWRLPARGPFSR